MISLILKHWKRIFFWGLFFTAISVGISMFLPRQYSAESQVLIITRDRYGVDPYTQAKAAERVGENLAQIMITADFYNKVMNSEYSFDRNSWKNISTERLRRKNWQKNVLANVIYGTSLMKITVYRSTAQEAVALSNAVTQTLSNRGWEYVGGDVIIKVVSEPLASRWYAKPNFAINGFLGFLVGVFLSALWVVRYKKHHVFGN
mgnify:CR=1 FL=1